VTSQCRRDKKTSNNEIQTFASLVMSADASLDLAGGLGASPVSSESSHDLRSVRIIMMPVINKLACSSYGSQGQLGIKTSIK
jgi:hypothetical protein